MNKDLGTEYNPRVSLAHCNYITQVVIFLTRGGKDMTGQSLLMSRKKSGLSQLKMARLLGLSQPMLSQMENGKRNVSPEAARLAVKELRVDPTELPLTPSLRHNDDQLAADLGALEYPGFFYMQSEPRNPAELLLDALDRPDLDVRVAEGLPWVPMHYPHLDWKWLTQEVKQRNRQNRLGFVVALSQKMAKQVSKTAVVQSLTPVLEELNEARLAKVDTFCQDSWPPSQRAYAHEKRSRLAAHWNLDTRLSEADLAHYAA
jgi:transcriptional regulator with XRE-family HTH domain